MTEKPLVFWEQITVEPLVFWEQITGKQLKSFFNIVQTKSLEFSNKDQ